MLLSCPLLLALVILAQAINSAAKSLLDDRSHGGHSGALARKGTFLSEQSSEPSDNKNSLSHINGFYFENPSLDCKYVSQPFIYKTFTSLEFDVEHLFAVIHPQVDFTVVGHHPLAGHYHDLKHFYINALYRLNNCIRGTYPEDYKITLQYIHGGCDQSWSVQEVFFEGRANNGQEWHMVNVWITRWEEGKMIEVRTSVDAADVRRLLFDNEEWTNSTTETEHYDFLPGPAGMPRDVAILPK